MPIYGLVQPVESRDFPIFSYDSNKGEKWGARFEIDNNPDSAQNWPVLNLEITEGEDKKDQLSLPFTFADFAAQDPEYATEFKVVPQAYWTKDLVLLSGYLTLSQEDEYGKIPFIWMVDHKNELVKMAVSWSVVLACRERLDFWHYLQESSGLNNYHVERAVEQTRKRIDRPV